MTPLHHVLNQFNLRNHVTSPTRVTSSTATLLDLFLSATPIQGVCETIHLDISDHFAILARLPISASHHLQGQHQRKTHCLHKVDWNMFTCDLEKTLTTCDSVCVDMLASSLTAGIQTTLDKHAPLRKRRRKSRRPCPWITDELVASVRERTGRIVSGSETKPIRTFKKHTDQLAPKHGSWTGVCATCTSLRDVIHQINGNFGLS